MHDAVPAAEPATAPDGTDASRGGAGLPGERADAGYGRGDEALHRALADLDNLRKRYNRELTRERDAERRRVAAAWLPVVDNLDRALEHASAGEPGADGRMDCRALLEGVR